jgi:hypothetical protein
VLVIARDDERALEQQVRQPAKLVQRRRQLPMPPQFLLLGLGFELFLDTGKCILRGN